MFTSIFGLATISSPAGRAGAREAAAGSLVILYERVKTVGRTAIGGTSQPVGERTGDGAAGRTTGEGRSAEARGMPETRDEAVAVLGREVHAERESKRDTSAVRDPSAEVAGRLPSPTGPLG